MGIRSALGAAVLGLVLLGTPARAEVAVPAGYEVEERAEIAAGVEHLRLERNHPPLVVHVGVVRPEAGAALHAVLSNDAVAGPAPRLERTSSMCRRAGCLLAVNADFYRLDAETPLGGMVSAGRLVESPNPAHHQLLVTRDGRLAAGSLPWSGNLVPTDLRYVNLAGVNVERGAGQVVVYTPAYGASTGTNAYGAEIVARVVEPEGPLRLGETAVVELVELRDGAGDAQIPPDGIVLSGHDRGADALRGLWGRVEDQKASPRALLRFEAGGDVVESVGGTPILLREGRRWFADREDTFTRGRHPRTAVGWNAAGEILLVTVDGRQPGYSAGMTLEELADLMMGLGASEAINLDGGGSTTFVVRGEVANRPSDRAVRSREGTDVALVPRRGAQVLGNVERPVANALAVVPDGPPQPQPARSLADELRVPPPASSGVGDADPASEPNGSLPALVAPREAVRWPWAAAALAGNFGVALALGRAWGRARARA